MWGGTQPLGNVEDAGIEKAGCRAVLLEGGPGAFPAILCHPDNDRSDHRHPVPQLSGWSPVVIQLLSPSNSDSSR